MIDDRHWRMSDVVRPSRMRESRIVLRTAILIVLGLLAPCTSTLPQVAPSRASVASVRIGVLGLFHPQQFAISALPGHALMIRAGDEHLVLEASSGVHTASVTLSKGEIILHAGTRTMRAWALAVAGRANEPTDFVLAVPGKIARRYRGTLEIYSSAGQLLALVVMEREIAVASIVAAESTADTPLEALKAQAVATRSYLIAGRGRHHDFDFCDSTHCQFLREPPASDAAAARAVAATRGMVLAYKSEPFAAMYTRSCSGRTRTPSELDLSDPNYPYYPVECRYCREHPVRWSSRISAQDAISLRSSSEASRLRAARRLGWNTIPSNEFVMKNETDHILLEGTGQGHGIGLCQAGAKAMAADGADFRQILGHYYPNTSVVSIDPVSASR